MKYIKVNLRGRFKADYSESVRKGRWVKIDLLKKWGGLSIGGRVVNIWKRPEWFDLCWFEFVPKKK